jgi:SAM-dependent methyltransferase
MTRTSFQGVATVFRFNWHLYAVASLAAIACLAVTFFGPSFLKLPAAFVSLSILVSTTASLLATWCAYDASALYHLAWLHPWLPTQGRAANIHAGFDETTALLRQQFPTLSWHVFDFYDPAKHTEISIRRARLAHPPATDTVSIQTQHLPLADGSYDCILLTLAAHEIRDAQERTAFFRELYRALKPDGVLIITEHLRDLPNLIAYNVGAFHFHSLSTWKTAFSSAQFTLGSTLKPAPLITTFVLKKHGTPA